MYRVLVLIVVLATSARAPDGVKEAIEARVNASLERFAAGDLDTVMQKYSDDPAFIRFDGKVLNGIHEIRKFFDKLVGILTGGSFEVTNIVQGEGFLTVVGPLIMRLKVDQAPDDEIKLKFTCIFVFVANAKGELKVKFEGLFGAPGITEAEGGNAGVINSLIRELLRDTDDEDDDNC